MAETLWFDPDSPPVVKPIRKAPRPGMIVCDAGARFRWLVCRFSNDAPVRWGLMGMGGYMDKRCWNVSTERLVDFLNDQQLQELE